jgi:hypothetical protein
VVPDVPCRTPGFSTDHAPGSAAAPCCALGHVHQQGVVQVAKITPGQLSAFIRARSHLARSSVALSIRTLRSFLRVGFAQGWLPSD